MNNYSNDNYQQNEGYDYSANRCRICNRELQDPRQIYGEWCARKNGLDPYGGALQNDVASSLATISYQSKNKSENIDKAAFEQYNNLIITNPLYAQQAMYNANDMEKEELNSYIRAYVKKQGGMKQGNDNIYQVIYTAPITNDETITNSRDMNIGSGEFIHSDMNMYDNYEFTIFDAINWLIQTGGRGNFVLQTRSTENSGVSALNQRDVLGKFIDAHTFLKDASLIEDGIYPKFYIGSTEQNAETAEAIYDMVTEPDWVKNKLHFIGGIYFGREDVLDEGQGDTLDNMKHLSNLMHSKGKKVLWIPYYDSSEKLEKIQQYARRSFPDATPIIDTIIIQPGAFYGKDVKSIDEVKDVVSKFNNDPDVLTRVGIEMEFDMGLVTGRKDDDMGIYDKRKVLQEYLNTLPELKEMNVPIGVYSGGPNEQGYRDIRNNINTHNSGNHIPYWEGIDESAYATGVHYNHFPNAYQGGNLIYDINNYIYNDVWKDSLEKSMWLSRPIQ